MKKPIYKENIPLPLYPDISAKRRMYTTIKKNLSREKKSLLLAHYILMVVNGLFLIAHIILFTSIILLGGLQ